MNPVSPIKRAMGLALALVMAGSAAACAGPASSAPSVSQPAAVTDGVYTAQVNGFSLTSPMNVEVTIADGRLADIALGENSETQNVGVLAVEQLIPRILESQSVSVDSIAGATVTSAALKLAVTDCYEQTGGNAADLRISQPESTGTETYDVDVAVVGFGGSGAAAALAAAQSGASVMTLEKAGRIGGTSSVTGGINVDESMHVLDAEGQVVENLYAVGTDSMGVLFTNQKGYTNYGGVAQGWCYVSGRIAGLDAAASLQ